MARVFVGVPTLNRPRLVVETIDSLRGQTFSDFRVVVSDNGSAPEVADAVERHIAAMNDPRFSFHRQPINGGEYGQGWFFYDQAQPYEFMVVLHDDDLIDPDYLGEAVAALDRAPTVDVFVANPLVIDAESRVSESMTADYHRQHGRVGATDGPYDIRTSHLLHGFTPISGTMFRVAGLRASGFVDPDCHGNFPFEFNLFLRLGDIGAQGWFASRPLLRIRYHTDSFRGTHRILDNPHVVRTMLKLLERRTYSGAVERRRRIILGRLRRADGLIRLRDGDLRGCRRQLVAALGENASSPKAIAAAALAWGCPGLLRSRLPPVDRREIPPAAPRPMAQAG